MSLSLTWEIEGEKQLVRRLRGVREELRDWTPAFRKTADELKGIFQNDVFVSSGDAIQEPWQPLSPAYSVKKQALYPGKGILERTGQMRASFKSLYKSDMAAVWNTAEYFKYHQSNKPRKKIPRRIMMKLGHQQREIVVKIFHTHFKKKLK